MLLLSCTSPCTGSIRNPETNQESKKWSPLHLLMKIPGHGAGLQGCVKLPEMERAILLNVCNKSTESRCGSFLSPVVVLLPHSLEDKNKDPR